MSLMDMNATMLRFSGQRGRTADGMGKSGVRYPNPFFDIGHTYLPPSIKTLHRWCRFYFLTSPLINSVIFKMSEYPITELIIDETNPDVKNKWDIVLNQSLRYRPFQIETGLDYYTYGIALITIHFPFTKWLICRSCKHKEKATKTDYRWRNLEYVINCDKCHSVGPAIVQDYNEKDVNKIRLQRWNPEYVHIDPGFGGADPIYTFQLPLQVRNDLVIGKKNVTDTVPDVFVEAMRRNKFIRFTDDNLFVMKRPIISQNDEGWGMPLIFPVLKDAYYLQILRKAQEAIMQEHIVPLRVIFPQAGSATSDPYSTISLSDWKTRMEQELAMWKQDPNRIPVLPLPIGHEVIGGDGKALMLSQEMQAWSEQIIAGMGVPREFIMGGLSYSGSNVSMRMLENSFIGYRTDHHNMLNNFVIRRIADYMGWPVIKAHMSKFKMADDLQRMQLQFQLNQAQKISDMTLLQECGLDPMVERERKDQELGKQMEYNRKMQLSQAHLQADVQGIQMKAQMAIQEEQAKKQAEQQAAMAAQGGAPGGQPGQPPQPGQGGQPQPGAEQGQPPMPGQPPQSGPEGAMVPGTQVDQAMPEGSTVSMENGQQAPAEGIPLEAQSPLTMGQQGGGVNLLYLAAQAANRLKEMDEMTKSMELNKMKATNPQLYMLVIKKLSSEKGSQADPLDPTQSPLPEQKPSRRAAPVGM